MNDISCAPAIVAAVLHHVFAASTHAPDSLELWLAVTTEATRQLTTPIAAPPPSWLAVFTVHRSQRTDARYHPATAMVEITTGPLTWHSLHRPRRCSRRGRHRPPGSDHYPGPRGRGCRHGGWTPAASH